MPVIAPITRFARTLHNAEALDAMSQGAPFWLSLPIDFNTADGTPVYTVPLTLASVGNDWHGTDGVTTAGAATLTSAVGGIVGSEFVGGFLVVQEGPNRGTYPISGTPGATSVVISGMTWKATTTNQKFRIKRADPQKVTLTGEASKYVDIQIEITTGGARGTAVFKWSDNGGATYTTGVTTAATVTLTGTGLTANFPDTGTYATTARWEQTTTIPRLVVLDAVWDIRTAFTGGSSSSIGLSSSMTGSTAKGSVLGGAAGDATGILTANVLTAGTAGTSYASSGLVWLGPGATIRFDRITSAFTAGSGFVQLLCSVMPRS